MAVADSARGTEPLPLSEAAETAPAVEAPSIVGAIRALYEFSDRRKPSTGYPTGSRLGTCAAQLQMLRYPDLSTPERTPVRTVMGFDEGHRTEQWLAERLQQAYPGGLVGLRQELFYFPVGLPERWMLDELASQIASRTGRRLWGTVIPGFRPPRMKVEDGRVKIAHLVERKPDGSGPKPIGFVLDPPRACVWVPVYIDFALLHPTLGLGVLEAKSMSNFAFRRAVLGQVDYGKRAQLVGIRAATGCWSALIAYRKETHHLAEIAYLEGAGRTRVVLTRPNGQQAVFYPEGEGLAPAEGGAPTWPADMTWESASAVVWTPDDPELRRQIGDRVRRVLLGKPGEWHREAGPTFHCEKCGGAGERACRHCKGRGTTEKTRKPCGGECKGGLDGVTPGMVRCPDCAGRGALQDAELGFPCSYCPVVGYCWRDAGLRLEIDEKPHYLVNRERYEAAGLTFTPPEGPRG